MGRPGSLMCPSRMLTALEGAQIDNLRQGARVDAGGIDIVLLDLLRARRGQALARYGSSPAPCSRQPLVAIVEQRVAASSVAIARFSTTQASTSSSRSSSFTAITAACCTSGCVSSMASTSAAAMFSPERRMMFFLRSTKCSMPSGPRRHDVAGVEPAAPPGGLRRRLVLEIAREEAARAAFPPSGARASRPARPSATSRSSSSTTRTSMPGTARPEGARADLARLDVSPSTRTISVMPQSSISGKPKRSSNAACSSGSMPAPMPKRTLWRRSSRRAAELQQHGAITPDSGQRSRRSRRSRATSDADGSDRAGSGSCLSGWRPSATRRRRSHERAAADCRCDPRPGADRPRRRARRTRRRTRLVAVREDAALRAGRWCRRCRGCWPASRGRVASARAGRDAFASDPRELLRHDHTAAGARSAPGPRAI